MLKKSAMVCASEKYASEIEIFTFGRGFRTRISRSSVQKRHFHRSMIRQFGQIDFFNRIGQKQMFTNEHVRPKETSSRLETLTSKPTPRVPTTAGPTSLWPSPMSSLVHGKGDHPPLRVGIDNCLAPFHGLTIQTSAHPLLSAG